MQARVVAVIAERLTVALAAMPQVCPKPESRGEAVEAGRDTAVDHRTPGMVVGLRGFEPLTPCMPLTSPPLAPLRASTRYLISLLLSTSMAVDGHRGYSARRCEVLLLADCWQIAGRLHRPAGPRPVSVARVIAPCATIASPVGSAAILEEITT